VALSAGHRNTSGRRDRRSPIAAGCSRFGGRIRAKVHAEPEQRAVPALRSRTNLSIAEVKYCVGSDDPIAIGKL
jgi:hypothetical protein